MVWTPLQKQKRTARAPEASHGGQGSPKGADRPGREGQCGLNREGEHGEGSGGTRRSPRQSSTSRWRAQSKTNGSTSRLMTKCTEHQGRQRRRKGQMFSEDSICLHQLWRLKFSPGSAPSQPSPPIHLLHGVLSDGQQELPASPPRTPCCRAAARLQVISYEKWFVHAPLRALQPPLELCTGDETKVADLRSAKPDLSSSAGRRKSDYAYEITLR